MISATFLVDRIYKKSDIDMGLLDIFDDWINLI